MEDDGSGRFGINCGIFRPEIGSVDGTEKVLKDAGFAKSVTEDVPANSSKTVAKIPSVRFNNQCPLVPSNLLEHAAIIEPGPHDNKIVVVNFNTKNKS